MGERTSNQMESLSIQTKNRSPRDLLERFMVGTAGGGTPGGSDPDENQDPGTGEEVELNLGLSLGGRFGVDKSDSKLMRSSSIAAILPVVRDDDVLGGGDGSTGPGGSHSGLVRTASLPVETEDEWRKRKELQSLRRLAAKRRRSEKQRNLTRGEREEYVAAMRHVGSSAGPSFGSGKWVSGGGATAESQGSVSEFESSHLQGSSGSGCEGSSLQEQSNQNTTGSSRSNTEVRPEPESSAKNKGKEIRSSLVEDMPCVFTKGDGPNGRRVEGILYKYAKGEQVKIMCVCHGSFLSPAEFVRHAGGTDMVHPLKHIVVNPCSFS